MSRQGVPHCKWTEDIALILPLLLPEADRKHLLNLADGKTAAYKGDASLRAKLRSFRDVGLAKSLPDVYICESWVEMTDQAAALVECSYTENSTDSTRYSGLSHTRDSFRNLSSTLEQYYQATFYRSLTGDHLRVRSLEQCVGEKSDSTVDCQAMLERATKKS